MKRTEMFCCSRTKKRAGRLLCSLQLIAIAIGGCLASSSLSPALSVGDSGRQLNGGTESQVAKERTSKPELVLQTGHRLITTDVVFSPDGRQLATTSWDCTVKLWDAATGEIRRTLEGHLSAVNTIAFSPDGQLLVSAGGVPATHDTPAGSGEAKLWDVETGRLLFSFPAFPLPVSVVAFSPDGKTVATAGFDKVPSVPQIRCRARETG